MSRNLNKKSSNARMIDPDPDSSDDSDSGVYLDEEIRSPPRSPPQPPQTPKNYSASKTSSASKRSKASRRSTNTSIDTSWQDPELDRQYDLTPLGEKNTNRSIRTTPSYSIDPYEVTRAKEIARAEKEKEAAFVKEGFLDDTDSLEVSESEAYDDEGIEQESLTPGGQEEDDPTFLMPGDIHPNMEANADEISQLRLLAGKLSADWRSPDFMAPALARRIRDFQFAQEKRRKKYGDERPWGILGLYDHLASVRIDCQWAEDSALRRANGDSYRSWAEFDESKKGGSNRPYFTYFLLFVCTAIMIVSIALNGFKVEPISDNPMIGPSAQTLIKMGAKDSHLIVVEDEGWRLLTSTLLHAGLVHYFVNMLALWFVGAAIEMSHGWVAAAIIFTISAIGGAILSAIFLPEYITVGASGGIFGFIGACLADIIMNWKLLFCDFVTENGTKHRHAMVVVVLLLDIGLNSIIGLTPFVDNFTHLGGMMYGFFCGISTMGRVSTDFFGLEEGVLSRTKHFIARFFGVIISVAAIIATVVILLQGDGETDPCPGCTWLSCVPFPPWEDDTSKWWYCDDCNRVTADIITQPSLHLDLHCPNGATAYIDLAGESRVDRDTLEKRLPSFCRDYCSTAEDLN